MVCFLFYLNMFYFILEVIEIFEIINKENGVYIFILSNFRRFNIKLIFED